MSGDVVALARLAVVVGLLGAALALVSFAVLALSPTWPVPPSMAPGGATSPCRCPLGMSGAECLVVALLVARGEPMEEDA